jgi:hypothetical protein
MPVSGKQSMIRSVAAGLCIAAWLSSVQAGPLNKEWVDSEARWVVHMDVESMIGSSYGLMMRQLYQTAIVGLGQGEAGEVLRKAGVDLMRDVKGATLYGMDIRGEEGVLLVHGMESLDRLLEPLAEHLPGFEKLAGAEPLTFSWMEGSARRFGRVRPGAAAGERLIILAPGLEQLGRVELVLSGGAPSLAAAAEDPMSRTPAAGSVLFILAQGLNEGSAAPGKGQAAVLSRLTSNLALDIGESNMESWMQVSLTARKDREADAMVQMMHGMIAMAQVTAQGEPEYERFAAMLDAVSIGKEGRVVTATMKAPSSLMMEALSAMPSLQLHCDVPGENGTRPEKK